MHEPSGSRARVTSASDGCKVSSASERSALEIVIRFVSSRRFDFESASTHAKNIAVRPMSFRLVDDAAESSTLFFGAASEISCVL